MYTLAPQGSQRKAGFLGIHENSLYSASPETRGLDPTAPLVRRNEQPAIRGPSVHEIPGNCRGGYHRAQSLRISAPRLFLFARSAIRGGHPIAAPGGTEF